jgi:tetratricopeptide (TPR) repeat protein
MKFAEALASCELLLEQSDHDRVLRVLELAFPSIRSSMEWQQALTFLELIPLDQRIESVQLATAYAHVLNKNRRYAATLEFASIVVKRHGPTEAARVRLESGGALFELRRFEEARKTLTEVIVVLSNQPLGIAHHWLGLVLFNLKESWRQSFVQARGLLTGPLLGRSLLDEGYCLADGGFSSEARSVWLEALPLFRSQPKMLAWVRYNLGITALRDLDPEAERHFLEADLLTRKQQAKTLRPAVLNGLASSRRIRGEWSRAEFTYRACLEIATDLDDRLGAYIGLTRTLSLTGRHTEAFEVLEDALSEPDLEKDLLHVIGAGNHLALRQPDRARQSLAQVGVLVSEYHLFLERTIRAELSRQVGNPSEALKWLISVPVGNVYAREEFRRWPELFTLAKANGLDMPVPLEYGEGTIIRVQAKGVLHVWVNDRNVPISPTGRAGELLVFLLEHDGEAPLDVILDAFYPNATDAETRSRARKMIWEHASALRVALGWQGALIALRGAYQLDPSAQWRYDIRDLRTARSFSGEFLAGVYSEWVLEVGQELAQLSSESASVFNLN